MITMQGCHQTIHVITGNKVIFHLLSLHCGYGKRYLSPFVTQTASKICCTNIAAYVQGPALVLAPSLAAKVKVVDFCDEKITSPTT
jgi:hypothetical protein